MTEEKLETRRGMGGKWWIILILLAAGGAAARWYTNGRHEAAPEYQTSAVARGSITQVVTATGQLGPVVNVAVGSQISGLILKLYVDFNSTVKSNQVIAEIDPTTYRMNLMKAEADLANSKANAHLTKLQAERSQVLFKGGLVSASDNDVAQAQLLQAEAQVESSAALRENAKVDLSHCTIYAPVDGVVISRNVDVGQTVAASFNTPTLFTIANDLAKMQIDALVSEADIGGVAVGQAVNFTVDAYPYRTFTGGLSQVRYGAITNQNVINYDCVIGVTNADLKLLPGMTANVSIILAERTNVLKIPNAALRFHPPEAPPTPTTTNTAAARPAAAPGSPAPRDPHAEPAPGPGAKPDRRNTRTVYVLPARQGDAGEPPKPKQVTIEVGISDGISTEVLTGLGEQDQVVIGVVLAEGGAKAPTANPFGGPRRF